MADYLDALGVIFAALWVTFPYVALGVTIVMTFGFALAVLAWFDGELIAAATWVLLMLTGPAALLFVTLPWVIAVES